MSATATRREIRKAFGPVALQAFDQHAEALVKLDAEVADHTKLLLGYERRIGVVRDSLHERQQLDIEVVTARLLALESAGTVWTRLRWLVTGR